MSIPRSAFPYAGVFGGGDGLPLAISLSTPIAADQIHIDIDGEGALSLAEVEIFTAEHPTVKVDLAKQATLCASSAAGHSAPLSVLHDGDPLHPFFTATEKHPSITITLNGATNISRVSLFNRSGIAAASCSAKVRVHLIDGGVTKFTYSNSAPEQVESQKLRVLRQLLSVIDNIQFGGWCDSNELLAAARRVRRTLAALECADHGVLSMANSVANPWKVQFASGYFEPESQLVDRFRADLSQFVSCLVDYVMSLQRDKALSVADSCCTSTYAVTRASGILNSSTLFCGILANLIRARLRPAGYAFQYYAFCCRDERVDIDTAGLINGHKRLLGKGLIEQSLGLTKHGFWRSLRGKDGKGLMAGMMKLIALFKDSLSIDLFLLYGTLLGAVREKTFIPHDDDIDLALYAPVATKEEAEQFVDELHDRLRALNVNAERLNRYFVRINGIDVFVVWGVGAELSLLMQKGGIRAVPKALILPLGIMEFYGEQVPVPADPEGFLEARYGTTWRTPDPYFEI